MPQFTLNIPTNKLQTTLDGFAIEGHLDKQNANSESEPITKQQNAKNMLRWYVRRMYILGKTQAVKDSVTTAQQTAATESEEITI